MSLSPILIQFTPSSDVVMNSCIGRGEPPLSMLKRYPKCTHLQLSGISNGSSPSLNATKLLFSAGQDDEKNNQVSKKTI